MIKLLGFVLIFLASESCSTKAVDNQIFEINAQEMKQNSRSLEVNENSTKAKTQEKLQVGQTDIDSIKNTKGLIVLSDRYGKNDFIRFYNEDGSLWYEFTYYYDDSDGKFEYANENFTPFSFHQDYFVLALKCVGEDKNRYEVIVDEETGLKKFVRKDDATLKFETWEKHILKTFAVDFNREQNPLREVPEGQVKTAVLPKEATFHPVEINGEWLKVSWDSSKKAGKNDKSGWVKWREDNKILVELFYFS